jgi:hypothetical protein
VVERRKGEQIIWSSLMGDQYRSAEHVTLRTPPAHRPGVLPDLARGLSPGVPYGEGGLPPRCAIKSIFSIMVIWIQYILDRMSGYLQHGREDAVSRLQCEQWRLFCNCIESSFEVGPIS